jgi:hypothetical protein
MTLRLATDDPRDMCQSLQTLSNQENIAELHRNAGGLSGLTNHEPTACIDGAKFDKLF